MHKLNMRRLCNANLNRLSKICGMFSSVFEGERANAAALADRFLRDRGLTWADILPTQLPSPTSTSPAWRQVVAACRARPDLLTEWERAFLAKVATYQKGPSGKQAEILATIAAKVAKK
jgi:hypothetical protein